MIAMIENASAGYLYILQNESLAETHLKIGRTTTDPHFRASDISRSTGVPTPFEVAWSAYTTDCHTAERLVHESLSEYRTNPRREFFDLDLALAISAAEEAVDLAGRGSPWWDRATAGRRTWGAFLFHSFFRPLARLPVEVVLLAGFLCWVLLKWSARGSLVLLSLAFCVVQSALSGIARAATR